VARLQQKAAHLLTALGGPFPNQEQGKRRDGPGECWLTHCAIQLGNMGAKAPLIRRLLMNKGLESFEAHWLFGFDAESIGYLVQSRIDCSFH